MSIIVLSIICGVAGYVTWETIKYKKNARNNKNYCCDSNKKKEKPKRYKKISKAKVQNKRKPRSTKNKN